MLQPLSRSIHTQSKPKVVCLIPAYNEATSIVDTINACRQALSEYEHQILVVDNNSTDKTHALASIHADQVVIASQQGKGHAVRLGLQVIQAPSNQFSADVVVMVDGDNTYDVSELYQMITEVVEHRIDMVIGTRQAESKNYGRIGHGTGNKFFSWLFKSLFQHTTADPFSGLRVFSSRFVKSYAKLASGFEIESEMNVHAYEHNLNIKDIPVRYIDREAGSTSKLKTFADGFRILNYIIYSYQRKAPLRFYSLFALPIMVISAGGFLDIYIEFLFTSDVLRQPSLYTYIGMGISGLLLFLFGVFNENVNQHMREIKCKEI